MTVAELIAKLQEMPQDADVIVDGYEGGYDDVSFVLESVMKRDVNDESYYGPHETEGYRWGRKTDGAIVPCVYLGAREL